MNKKTSSEVMALIRIFVDGGITGKDIRYFLGISERTVKRYFKRGKGLLRSGFHLSLPQKEAIIELHHRGRSIFEISRQINLPAKYVLKFIVNMTEENWSVRACPACRRLFPARIDRPQKLCPGCSREKKAGRERT